MASFNAPDNTLYLIDGHAQIFRAYYAIRTPMNSPVTGEPTGAVFAFTGMMLKLFEQFRPKYVVMAIDTGGKTHRDELYEHYKATREATPDDFAPQVERILEITRLFGVPIIGKEGAEADDIIATITKRLLDDPRYADLHIRIVSKDKDLEQLLSDRVTMFDIHTDTTIDVETLRQTKGISPDQVVDMLTLMGDTVDNIPGATGIGPKTAAMLIQQFGSIENLYANLDQIKGKRRENLEAFREQWPLSRELVRLKFDVDIDFDLEKARIGAIDATGLRRIFTELGFRRHVQDLERLLEPAGKPATLAGVGTSGGGQGGFQAGLFDSHEALADRALEEAVAAGLSTASDCDYRAITTLTELQELRDTLAKQELFALDTETIGLGHDKELCGLSFAWTEGCGVYVPICSPDPGVHLDRHTVLQTLRPVLEDPTIGKCGHNLKYDLLVLRYAGVNVTGVRFDSMIASHLIGAPGHSLDTLARSLLKHEMIAISRLIGERVRGMKQKTMDQVPLDQIVPYASEDADIALRLCRLFEPQIKAMGLEHLARDVEMPLVEVLADMEFNGIRVDPDELENQKKQLAKRIEALRDAIFEKAGGPFNIDSPRQLGELLFTKLKLPVIKKTKTGASTDIEVLEALAELDDLTPEQAAVPKLIVEYRQLTKLVNTYLENLRDSIDKRDGRVHATFHQTGAATGRLSSSGPNLQNIPIRTEVGRQIRKAFVAEPGHALISADYSQIELRMLAHLSQDAALREAFISDQDIHAAVAARVFHVDPRDVTPEQRVHAKTINFGIIYGVTPYGLARRIEGLDLEGARTLIADYRQRFSGIDAFLKRCIDQALQDGFVTTILGRRREIPQITSRNPNTRNLGERLAINTVVQGSAADLIKLAMVNLHRRILREKLPLKLLLQIHDELVLEAPQTEAERCAAVVREEMENAMQLDVPLKVEVGIGPDWLNAK